MSDTFPNAEMTLADFTSPGLIIPSLRGRDVAAVIQELSEVMRRENRLPDMLPFYNAAMNREFLVSTDIEPGMAFPHARLSGLAEMSFALGRSDVPVTWSARGLPSVRLVFLTAVPATDSSRYLLLISGLARLARDIRLISRLHTEPDGAQMFEVLRGVKLRTRPASAVLKKGMI